jgi:hypothetical protein
MMKPVVTAALAVGAFCAAFAVIMFWPVGQKKIVAATPTVAIAPDLDTHSNRNAYRFRLDHAFLESGINVDVIVRTESYKGMQGFDVPFPALVFFGPFSRVSVYKVAGSLNKFDDARKFGFKTVQFQSKLSEGTWTFDIRKPSPTCDRGLCF